MSNEFYNPSNAPSTGASLSSAVVRSEFSAIGTGLDKLPTMTGNGGKLVKVNSGGTALEAVASAYQPYSANLDEYAAVNPTTAGLALLDDADAAAQRTTLGIAASTDTYTNKTLAADTNNVEARSAPGASQFSHRNKIINGGFDVWQRGTSFVNPLTVYGPDRWYLQMTNITVTQVSGSTYGRRYACRCTATNSANTIGIDQPLELSAARSLQGKSATASFYAVCSSGTAIGLVRIYKNSTADTRAGGSFTTLVSQIVTVTTTPTRFTVTGTIPSDGTAEGLLHYVTLSGITNGAYVDLYDFQLEEGSVATPFETRPVGVELALCQRYYYRQTWAQNVTICPASAESATASGGYGKFPVTMRTAPQTLEQTTVANDYTCTTGGTGRVCSAVPTYSACSADTWRAMFTVASGQTAGQAGYVYPQNAGGAYLGWSAEL